MIGLKGLTWLMVLPAMSGCLSNGEQQEDMATNDTHSCLECVDNIMGKISTLIMSDIYSINEISEIFDIEDDMILAHKELNKEEYLEYSNSDFATTESILATRIKNAITYQLDEPLSFDLDLSSEGLCVVRVRETNIALTITDRPRCLITDVKKGSTSLLD